MSTPSEPAAPKRGRPRDPGIRTKVLTVTAAQFLESGYEAMTMEGIVVGSGIAKRTLYRWWPTKAAVVGDAILGGFIAVPDNPIPNTADIWADLGSWLSAVSTSMRGPWGEVLRASTAISATDPALGIEMADTFSRPAEADVRARLVQAVKDGQVSSTADLDATIDLLLAMIVYIGATRDNSERIRSIISIIKSGISQ